MEREIGIASWFSIRVNSRIHTSNWIFLCVSLALDELPMNAIFLSISNTNFLFNFRSFFFEVQNWLAYAIWVCLCEFVRENFSPKLFSTFHIAFVCIVFVIFYHTISVFVMRSFPFFQFLSPCWHEKSVLMLMKPLLLPPFSFPIFSAEYEHIKVINSSVSDTIDLFLFYIFLFPFQRGCYCMQQARHFHFRWCSRMGKCQVIHSNVSGLMEFYKLNFFYQHSKAFISELFATFKYFF